MKRFGWSKAIILLTCIVVLVCRGFKKEPVPISWDTAGYYLYLPAIFIYKDPGLYKYEKFDSLRVKYDVSSTFYQVSQGPKGNMVIRYTMGHSWLYSPFFFAGHMWALGSGAPADGFSKPYQYTLLWGMLVYGILALMILRKVLLRFFDDKVAAVSIAIIVFGTNLFYEISMNNLEVHYSLFFLLSLFLWQTIRYHDRPSVRKALFLGAVGGLIVATRPTDIVVWAVPFLWGVTNPKTFWKKVKTQWPYLIVFSLLATIMFFPQLAYWKRYAGQWFYNSYNNPAEGLDLAAPHTISFLFSYRKGWFIYTPLAITLLIGMVSIYKRNKALLLSIVVYLSAHIYLASSWTCWWYAGSFGSRAMIQSYAILVIPLGFLIKDILSSRKGIKLFSGGVLLLMVALNLFQTWQYATGILKPDRVTKAYYWQIFGRTRFEEENMKLLLRDKVLETDTILNPEEFLPTKVVQYELNEEYKHDCPEGDKENCLRLDTTRVFHTVFEENYKDLLQSYFGIVRVSGEFWNEDTTSENSLEIIRTMVRKEGLYSYRSRELLLGRESRDWQTFTIDYVLPDVRSPNDRLKAYFWLRGKAPVYLKELKIEVLEPKEFPELE